MTHGIWLVTAIIIGVALSFGWIIEKLVLRKLRKLSAQTEWEGDNIIFESLRGIVLFWFFLTGCYVALVAAPLDFAQFRALQKLLLVLAILSATLFFSRLASGFIISYSRKKEGLLPSATILTNVTKIIVFILGVLTILHTLGLPIAPALTALGVGGLAVALALQDSLSNLFAGLQILASKQIHPGNLVRLESGEEGTVTDITWRNTTIRTLPNNLVIIPNAKLASSVITNYDLPDPEMAVLLQVGVAYDSDLSKVENVAIEVAKEVQKEVPGGVITFEPLVRFHTFADSSIVFTLVLRAFRFTDQHLLKHECLKRLRERFETEGITIPFPIRTVHVRQ